MRALFISFTRSLVLLTLLTVILGIGYPLVICGIGQLFFSKKANGSLILQENGDVLGSELIAQNFVKPQYFHPRPSSAGSNGFDAAGSSGSNLGPTSQKLADAIAKRVSDYRAENNLDAKTSIPADAVTTSASGLDPHIGVANALLQASRVAQARNISEEKIKNMIAQYTEGGFFGENRINVLKLNLALDKTAPVKEEA